MPVDEPDRPHRSAADPREGAHGDPRRSPRRGSVRREVSSFGWALRGVGEALRTEPHLRFHALATLVVVGLAVMLPLDGTDRALLALAVGLVWAAELVNTALEAVVDLASPDLHPLARRAKDVGAGAVLIAALAAAACGALVLGPPLLEWFGSR